MDTSNLHGRTVLVTGAGSGIGRETALLAARRGADLAICDVDDAGLAEVEASARALGRGVLARHVDVSDREQMREFADAVHADAGAVDLLVNNAGVGLAAGLLDTELEDWDWIVSINLMGVVHGCHFFVPKMVERGTGGHVANLSSMAGFHASPGAGRLLDDEVRRAGVQRGAARGAAPPRHRGDRDLPGRHQHADHGQQPHARCGHRPAGAASACARSTSGATTGPSVWRRTSSRRSTATARSPRSRRRHGSPTGSSEPLPGSPAGWPGAWPAWPSSAIHRNHRIEGDACRPRP